MAKLVVEWIEERTQ